MTAWFLGFLPVVACAAMATGELVIGERLPVLKGEFLTGRTALLPQASQGRVALLLLGFTYESRFAVEAWAGKFRGQFQADPRVTFYEVPLIGGVARMAKWFIDGGMRRGTPKNDYEHVITVYGGTDAWKQRVGFKRPDDAYLVLLDHAGNVAWRHAGPLDEHAYGSLSSKVAELLRAE